MTYNFYKRTTLTIFTMIVICNKFINGDRSTNFCFDAYECPKSYDNVCTKIGMCYVTFRSTCEVNEANKIIKNGNEKYQIVANGKCESNVSYTPLCKICNERCTNDSDPICAFSCKDECYKTFRNECLLDIWNCNNINDYYAYFYNGDCELLESCTID